MKRVLFNLILVACWMSLSGQLCTKKIVYSRDFFTQPVVRDYEHNRATVWDAVQSTLERMGYPINRLEGEGRIETGWLPVEADSHFVNLFERKDYGLTDGTYYQVIVDMEESGSILRVAISTTVKSIVGKVESTKKIERRIFRQLDDVLRSPQIEMTNVGVTKR